VLTVLTKTSQSNPLRFGGVHYYGTLKKSLQKDKAELWKTAGHAGKTSIILL
jgi:hypothetical protein